MNIAKMSKQLDLSTAFALEVQEHCLCASIVCDLFFVVVKLDRKVMDRVKQANKLKQD